MTPTTVSESFVKWMEDNSYGAFGESIFLNQIPDFDANQQPIDNAFWVITAGGDVRSNLVTAQNIKQYSIQVFCRNVSSEEVEHKLYQLETQVNTRGSFTIDGFEIYSIESSMSNDNDMDAENRRQGSLVVGIEIYKSYVS
jgi:hypothetical protein